MANAGILHYFTESLFLDVFLDYTYLKINFDTPNHRNLLMNRSDLSGLSVGGGLGWRF